MPFSRLIIAASLLAAFAPAAHASTSQELAATRKEIRESNKRQAELEQEHKKLESELAALQKKLVDAVSDIQKVEQELFDTQQKLAVIAGRIKEKQAQVDKNKERLGAMISAALRFSRMPMEAMVMMPGDAKQRMRVSRALKMLSEDIRTETEALNLQLHELAELQEKLVAYKESVAAKKKRLEENRRELAAKLDERQALQDKLQSDKEKEAKNAAALARKASGLQELLDTLGREEARHGVKSTPGWASEAARKGKIRSFVRAKGAIRKPANGTVKERFGQSVKGLASKGISIETLAFSEVVAPYDGEVIFSGTFLTYGKMVIIKHSDGFHTLMAGLGRIDTRPGDFLLEGEPIGAMGDKSSRPRLYVELRKNNQPVNPSQWISGL